MGEQTYKIYDEMFNLVGVTSRKKIHAEGLLHQVVHLWMLGIEDGERVLYFQQRSFDRDIFPGHYDLICTSHIDPMETFEDTIVDCANDTLGLSLVKSDLKHIGNIRQSFDIGDYHDNAFAQIFFTVVDKPQFKLNGPINVVKAKFDDFIGFCKKEPNELLIYDLEGNTIGLTTSKDWWLRRNEFLTVAGPYIQGHFPMI